MMRNSYYFAHSDLGSTTCPMLLAISLVGLLTATQPTAGPIAEAEVAGVGCCQHVYYYPIERERLRAELMRRFGTGLLAATQDNPQPVVDLINRHFWELV
jgi:hypothetical protein